MKGKKLIVLVSSKRDGQVLQEFCTKQGWTWTREGWILTYPHRLLLSYSVEHRKRTDSDFYELLESYMAKQ